MTSYKLIYFDVRGRAETSRWLFKLAGVEFEDVRYPFAEWGEKKNDVHTPFGQLPCLEVKDDSGTWTLAQSHAIERYLAKKFGLLGKSDKDVAIGDSCTEHVTDTVMLLPWTEKDEEKKKQLMMEAVNGPITEKLKKLEALVQENGFFLGDGITLADVGFTVCMEFITQQCPNALDVVPKLKALSEKVRSEPKIAAWIAERPKSDF